MIAVVTRVFAGVGEHELHVLGGSCRDHFGVGDGMEALCCCGSHASLSFGLGFLGGFRGGFRGSGRLLDRCCRSSRFRGRGSWSGRLITASCLVVRGQLDFFLVLVSRSGEIVTDRVQLVSQRQELGLLEGCECSFTSGHSVGADLRQFELDDGACCEQVVDQSFTEATTPWGMRSKPLAGSDSLQLLFDGGERDDRGVFVVLVFVVLEGFSTFVTGAFAVFTFELDFGAFVRREACFEVFVARQFVAADTCAEFDIVSAAVVAQIKSVELSQSGVFRHDWSCDTGLVHRRHDFLENLFGSPVLSVHVVSPVHLECCCCLFCFCVCCLYATEPMTSPCAVTSAGLATEEHSKKFEPVQKW